MRRQRRRRRDGRARRLDAAQRRPRRGRSPRRAATALDKDCHEHEIVERRIEQILRPHSVWVQPAESPGLVTVANIQHLATPIHAQLASRGPRSSLRRFCIPLPPSEASRATRRFPRSRARGDGPRLVRGPVGWMDAAEDGEFCVAIRSALIRDRTAHCSPAAESSPTPIPPPSSPSPRSSSRRCCRARGVGRA